MERGGEKGWKGSHNPAYLQGLTLFGSRAAPLGRFHLISMSTTLLIPYAAFYLPRKIYDDAWSMRWLFIMLCTSCLDVEVLSIF